MISKELLSLVLGEKVLDIDDEIVNNVLSYKDLESYWMNLNLDTLGRLCKEWCITKDFVVQSNQTMCKTGVAIFMKDDGEEEVFSEDTELEAIIKATEWVAKEKGLLS